MKPIPLCRALIEEQELKAVEDVLKSGWLTHGPKTAEFEAVFAEYHNVKHAIAMNSCTSALFMAIIANGIKGEIIVPSFTFVASVNAIVTAGATPVFAEINYSDCNIDADRLESYITPRTEAIMVVHFAGQCCQMDKILAFAEKHGLIIIEDSAETIGGKYKDKINGSWGIGCYSFFPTKNITTGEGGMLTTNNDQLASKVRTLINHGIDKNTFQREKEKRNYFRTAVLSGYNFRLSNILATIGVEQMKKIDRMNDLRRQHSLYFNNQLSSISELDLPVENEDSLHVYQMYTIKVNKGDRNDVVAYLRGQNVEASVHFYPPVHLHPAYSDFRNLNLPVTDRVAMRIITLPMFPMLKREELDNIINFLKDYFARK